jgi:hypothetical protein
MATLVLLPNNGRSRIQLLQVVDDGVLYVHICFGEHIHGAASLHQLGEVGYFPHVLHDSINPLKDLNRRL